jgi:hypothetical protein
MKRKHKQALALVLKILVGYITLCTVALFSVPMGIGLGMKDVGSFYFHLCLVIAGGIGAIVGVFGLIYGFYVFCEKVEEWGNT